MKGIPILIVFFTIFLVASLLIPTPMFPGNILSNVIGNAVAEYKEVLSAVLNAFFYGIILWLVFAAVSRKFESEK